MKLSIPKQDLANAIRLTNEAVEKKNTIPILSSVLLSAKDNTLTVKLTDLDIMVETTVACEVSEPGALAVPAAMFKNIVDKCSADSTINISQKDGTGPLKVQYGRSRFSLQVLPAEDFPEFPTADMVHKFTVPVAHVTNLLKHSEFCVSTEETRYYLNGVYFHHLDSGAHLCAVATDGHRLAKITCEAPAGADKFGNANNPSGVIISRKTIKLIHHIIKGGGIEALDFQVSDSKIMFTAGNTIVSSKIVDGQFPDYQRVIPANNSKVIIADRVAFMSGVDRLTTIATQRGRAVLMSFTTDMLTMSAKNVEAGEATEELDIEYSGDPIEIGFNSEYFKEILENLGGDKVQLNLADPGSPALISTPGDSTAAYVAMPMRF